MIRGVQLALVAFAVAIVIVAVVLVIGIHSGSSTHSGTPPAPGSGCGIPPPSSSGSGLTVPPVEGNWTTYHGSDARSGYEFQQSFSTVRPSWAGPAALDGQIYAEPLVCGPSIYVATENNSVYAINASTGAIEWRTHLGDPVMSSTLPCGDIGPVSGITGTPVIDAESDTLYVVAFEPPADHVLYSISLGSGVVTGSTDVNPPGSTPNVEQQRGALALLNGVVYVPYGGLFGDCGAYHGWVVGVPTSGSKALLSYEVPTGREGGIWGTGGIVVGPNGNLYVATGNSEATQTFDFGDAVIELSPSLEELDYFAPTNWAELNSNDIDLGSLTPTVLPNGNLFQVGKEGVGYLLNGTHLGGIGGAIYNASVCAGAYGGTARVGNVVIVPCTNGLTAVGVGPSSFSLDWTTSSFIAGSPIVTGSVVWAVDTSNAHLLGFDFATGNELYSLPLSSVDHFVSPTAAPGALFVGAGDQVYSFSLT